MSWPSSASCGVFRCYRTIPMKIWVKLCFQMDIVMVNSLLCVFTDENFFMLHVLLVTQIISTGICDCYWISLSLFFPLEFLPVVSSPFGFHNHGWDPMVHCVQHILQGHAPECISSSQCHNNWIWCRRGWCDPQYKGIPECNLLSQFICGQGWRTAFRACRKVADREF